MEISIDKLKEMLSEAWRKGYSGCADLMSQDIDDLIGNLNVKKTGDYRIWTVEELRKLPVGTLFHNLEKGRGFVKTMASGRKCMVWKTGGLAEFTTNSFPWDKLMKIVEE